MKKIILSLIISLSVCTQASAAVDISKTLLSEWTTFHAKVDAITPQGDIGGYMLYRDYADMTLLWRTSADPAENEVIRFFMERGNGEIFAVTYHKTDVIVPGRVVLRRFVGKEPTGWINHTIDFATGEYLGTQGQAPTLTASEKKMMKEWGITQIN